MESEDYTEPEYWFDNCPNTDYNAIQPVANITLKILFCFVVLLV